MPTSMMIIIIMINIVTLEKKENGQVLNWKENINLLLKECRRNHTVL